MKASKYIGKSLFWGTLITLSFALFSCSNIISNVNEKMSDSDNSKKARLSITVNSKAARTILPEDEAFEDMEYTLKGCIVDDKVDGSTDDSEEAQNMKEPSLKKSWCSYSEMAGDKTIFLDKGEWTFILDVGRGGNILYSGKISTTITDDVASLNFTLSETSYFSEGIGSAKVTLILPSDASVTKAEARLLSIDYEPIEGFGTTEVEIDKWNTAVYLNDEIPSGIYAVQFKFYSALGEIKPGYSEIIQIKNGRESSATRKIQKLTNLHTITYKNIDGANFSDGYTLCGAFNEYEKIILPVADEISLSGLTFGGWFDNENFLGTPITEIPAGTAENVTLYAMWVEYAAENPSPFGSRYLNLNFIFNNQTLGTTTITIKRSEWQKMLEDYDYFYKNENSVHALCYTYEKDGVTWVVPDVGFRLRGGTSRYRPQGKDYPTDLTGHKKLNERWSSSYYSYAANCSGDDYRQAHFKVDFEEWLEDPDEFKMAGCMKSVALKRMDASCTREVMCYDLFHKYGIWTAPRASHTRLLFNFIEDDNTVTSVDFGVYEMFEEVNKQSLKARDEDNNQDEQYKNYWKNNKGNLWKVSGGGNLTTKSLTDNVGVEDIRIIYDESGTRSGIINDGFVYDLKTNKDNLTSAVAEFTKFVEELNALPSDSSEDSISEIKAFYEKWFDVEFFLKTYAISILVGMDDDYWANANNYYLYFDTGKKGSGKVYFIPFDYDNTLGKSIKSPGVLQNPLEWGRGNNRPLMDKLLLVPDYKELFKRLLLEVSAENSYWNFDDLSRQFLDWKNMVELYLNSPDLKGGYISIKSWNDSGGSQSSGCRLASNPNIYDLTRESFLQWLKD